MSQSLILALKCLCNIVNTTLHTHTHTHTHTQRLG